MMLWKRPFDPSRPRPSQRSEVVTAEAGPAVCVRSTWRGSEMRSHLHPRPPASESPARARTSNQLSR